MTTASNEVELYFGGIDVVMIDFGDGITEKVSFAKNDKWKVVKHEYSARTMHTITLTGEVTGLDCMDNKITTIDVNGNPELESLFCSKNELTNLDVSHLLRLVSLACNENQLTSLDVSRQTKLEKLQCRYNFMNADALNALFMSLPSSSDPKQIWISNNGPDYNGSGSRECDVTIAEQKGWKVLKGEGLINPIITITAANTELMLSFGGIGDVMIDFGNGVTDMLSFDKNDHKWVDVIYQYSSEEPHTVTITGEVTGFDCGGNKLTAIDVSGNSDLQSLYCSDNQLTVLDVRNLSKLGNLSCNNNQLTSLDVSQQIKLEKLYCRNNRLTSLNVSGLTKLSVLSCQYNYMNASALNNLFTSLPTANSPGELYVSNNGPNCDGSGSKDCDITIAERKGWKVLKGEELINSKITMTATNTELMLSIGGIGDVIIDFGDGVSEMLSFDINDHEWVDVIYQYSSEALRTITITGEVTGFDCGKNKLRTIDVSENSVLQSLYCTENQLTVLDVGNLSKLGNLSCNDNQLTSLDVSRQTNLEKLYCRHNRLTSLNVSGLTKLSVLSCQYNYMNATALNNLFTSLPTAKPPGELYVSNNGPNSDGSGSKDCDVTIAEKKGWKVSK